MTYPATTGDTAIQYSYAPGFEYDPVIDRFVAWSGSADVYTLDAATWTWTKHAPAATNTVVPSDPSGGGTRGRFRYIPSKNAYILVNSTSENVYFYKLTDNGTTTLAAKTKGRAPLSVFPNPARAGEVVTLTLDQTRIAGRLAVYNLQGQKVAEWATRAGAGLIAWRPDARAAGLYFARWKGNGSHFTKRILLR